MTRPCLVGIFLFGFSLLLLGCGEKEELAPKPSSNEVTSKTSQGLKITPAICELEANAGDKTVSAHFTITNENPTPLTIIGLDTNCSCLEVKAEDTVLDPGESTSIDAVFDIGKIIGESEKIIQVYTDRNRDRAVLLPVKVTVPPILLIEPKNLTWTLNAENESKKFRFTTVRDMPIHVLTVECSRPDIADVSLIEIEKGREYEIIITPKMTNDHVLAFVKIETDLEIPAHKNQMAFFSITTP